MLGIVALLHLIASHNIRPGELMAPAPSNEREERQPGSVVIEVQSFLIGSNAVSRPEMWQSDVACHVVGK